MDIRKGRHCVSSLHAHIVFVTKYRGKVFTSKHLDFIKTTFEHICESFETTLVEFEGEDNHVHLLVNYPPKIALSKLVNSLKGVSSRHLKNEFSELKAKYWKGALWSPSYFVGSCGGAPINIVKQYIEQQDRPL